MKYIVLLLTIILLANCGGQPELVAPLQIQSKPLPRPALTLPAIDKYRARNVEWIVVTPDNVKEVFAQLETKGTSLVLFALSDTGYENISLNTKEALKIILQQKAVINGYRRYYIEVDGAIYEFNQLLEK